MEMLQPSKGFGVGALVVGVIAGLLVGPLPAQAGTQDFTLVNDTGLSIVQLFISPSNTQDWEEDVLGVDVLEDGESADIEFSPQAKAEVWDMMIVDDDGDKVVWKGLRLNEISQVTLHYEKGGTPVADLE
jgi:hypothetical protein